MSILSRGAVGQQAGAGVLVRKGPPRLPMPQPPGGFPIDELPASPGEPPRGPLMLGPPEYYAALMGLLNILTNRLKDNQNDQEDDKCKIYSYKDRDKECPGGRSHHIVPDRCWRSPGTRRQRTGIISYGTVIDQLLDKYLSSRGGGYYYAKKMDDEKGQCICVSEEQHAAIHKIYDSNEEIVGESADPQWTSTLENLEAIGSEAASTVTGCNVLKIKTTLRTRHDALGLDKDLLLRADPRGKSGLTMQKFGEALSRASKMKPSN
ncbi:hypothetical protein INH39_21310 [Massilia violaceinigra]|uniref:Uncharacterized protein n=1 Tax=Massilia violaceinigra TaxID=2045208 RepID=A0ABY3ZZU5_9BURK|nr:hypothetical protein [Massilia violaceinigra]UOD28007.1 hypothetical protein INH39_21310 [Massilia violaceinigra]